MHAHSRAGSKGVRSRSYSIKTVIVFRLSSLGAQPKFYPVSLALMSSETVRSFARRGLRSCRETSPSVRSTTGECLSHTKLSKPGMSSESRKFPECHVRSRPSQGGTPSSGSRSSYSLLRQGTHNCRPVASSRLPSVAPRGRPGLSRFCVRLSCRRRRRRQKP